MRGRRRADGVLKQPAQNSLSQRRAFGRVSARAKLVKEHKVVFAHRFHDGDNIGHVRGEGGQGLLDGLLIADIGKDILKHGKLRAQCAGDMKAGLRHQRQQADGLERDGLAARIGAGDDERRKVLAQHQVAWNDLVPVNQRMAHPNEAKAPLPIQLGRNGLHLAGQAALGKHKVQMGENDDVLLDEPRIVTDLRGQRRQDALDFIALLGRPFTNLVA